MKTEKTEKKIASTWRIPRHTALGLLLLLAPALAGGAGTALRAQQPAGGEAAPGEFSLERIHGTGDFFPETPSVTWMADGESWATVEQDSAGRTELWRVAAASGERERLIPASELVPAGAAEPIAIEDFSFSADEERVLIFTNSQQVWRDRTKGEYYVFDLTARTLRPVSARPGWQMFAKFSPDGSRVAFVREHDLFVADLDSGEEWALTEDGSETIINGTTDWVYEEELGLRDAFRWSPDGSRIAYWHLDQSPIREFYLVDETSLYPELDPVRYPKAGTDNSRVRVGSVDVGTGETTWFDTGPGTWTDGAGDGPTAGDRYLARMEWADDSTVAIQRVNRHQNRLELLLGDPATGEVRPVLVEEDSAWVDVTDHLTWLDGGRRFLWSSERDGWRHLYLFERDGTPVRQVTEGEWPVTDFLGVDREEDRVYFEAAHRDPVTRQVMAAELDGGEPVVLLGGRGVHGAAFSPDFDLFLDTHSTVDTPPTTILYEVDGDEVATVRTVEDNAPVAARLDSAGLGTTEFMQVEAADGTPLNAWILKPRDFDPSRRYGLLLYVYGGPGSQTVMDRWGGTRYLWHQYLAKQGILVASVDNRGTGGRGRDFKKQTYLRLGELEAADQLAALSQLAALPYVDASRTGIWGWSYGGYMTLLATLLGEGRLAAGVSVAPVTHWKLYDTIYTERYMRTPAENPEGYDGGSPLSHAAKLESPLLLVHGTGDDNVHFQNTLLMVQALEEAGRQFDLRIYPNKRHGITGGGTRVNLFEMMTGFVTRHLGPAGSGAAGPAETGEAP